ncbi:MAG: hypothetical protein FJ029_14565 [Actinobacteria bacterium]|nr:hypothetical protein [Actinomycetota bacterium]
MITAPIDLEGRPANLSLNVDGLSAHSRVAVRVLDEQFRPVPGYGAEDMVTTTTAGFAQPVRWRDRATLVASGHVRLRIDFEGLRPEDVRLHAVYLAAA